MNLFRNLSVLSSAAVRFVNSRVIPTTFGRITTLSRNSGDRRFDGIQFALHKDLVALTYINENQVTANVHFFENRLNTDNKPLPAHYRKDSIKLLILHGIPLTSNLHDCIFNSDIDYLNLVSKYFNNGASRGAVFMANVQQSEQEFFPVTNRAALNYPAVYEYIKKCTEEPLEFDHEDHHFGLINADGCTTDEIEESLRQLNILTEVVQKPGKDQWICGQLANDSYCTRKYHFTIGMQDEVKAFAVAN